MDYNGIEIESQNTLPDGMVELLTLNGNRYIIYPEELN